MISTRLTNLVATHGREIDIIALAPDLWGDIRSEFLPSKYPANRSPRTDSFGPIWFADQLIQLRYDGRLEPGEVALVNTPKKRRTKVEL